MSVKISKKDVNVYEINFGPVLFTTPSVNDKLMNVDLKNNIEVKSKNILFTAGLYGSDINGAFFKVKIKNDTNEVIYKNDNCTFCNVELPFVSNITVTIEPYESINSAPLNPITYEVAFNKKDLRIQSIVFDN